MQILSEIKAALLATLVTGIIVCGVYPLVVWIIGFTLFPWQSEGSLVRRSDGTVAGSALLGQAFTDPRYFHSRPSSAGPAGYDAASSSGSNLGPTSKTLIDQVQERVAQYRVVNGLPADILIPADAVTASGSGLDRHISPRNAELQAPRVARARGLSEARMNELIQRHMEGPDLVVLGEPGVNVLLLNLALDSQEPSAN
jgi:K+-transporting ATPase ATPase C chain